VSVKLGAAVTVTTIGRALVKPPPVAVTVRVYFPGIVRVDGCRVSVLTPAPGAAKVAGEKEPVIPVGKPPTNKDVAELNVLIFVRLMDEVPGVPWTIEMALGLTAKPRLGGTKRVNGTSIVLLNVPPLAVMARV